MGLSFSNMKSSGHWNKKLFASLNNIDVSNLKNESTLVESIQNFFEWEEIEMILNKSCHNLFPDLHSLSNKFRLFGQYN